MSAFDDFPPATHLTLPQWERHKAILEEIDRLRLDAGYLDDLARTRGYEPLVDCGGEDCERQGAMIVHRPMCARWKP
jgi:hypothetical protein